MKNISSGLFYVFLFFLFMTKLKGQSGTEESNWDNVLYFGNKVAWGSESWRQSAEFQTRYNSDFGKLEQWHLEYILTYLMSEHIEIVPDFRFTRKPEHLEYRLGFGIIYKNLFKKSQLVHQLKWQWDKENTAYSSHGLRYAIFYNYVFTKNIVGSAILGGLFEFGKEFTDFLGIRTGLGVAYVFDKAHSVNLGYYYGAINTGNKVYTNLGIVSIQLIINIRKDYKYLPAKYITF